MMTVELERTSADDEELTKVRKCWMAGDSSEFTLLRNEVTAVGKLVMRCTRIAVPTKVRGRVLELAHEGHPGVVKMKDHRMSGKSTFYVTGI